MKNLFALVFFVLATAALSPSAVVENEKEELQENTMQSQEDSNNNLKKTTLIDLDRLRCNVLNDNLTIVQQRQLLSLVINQWISTLCPENRALLLEELIEFLWSNGGLIDHRENKIDDY